MSRVMHCLHTNAMDRYMCGEWRNFSDKSKGIDAGMFIGLLAHPSDDRYRDLDRGAVTCRKCAVRLFSGLAMFLEYLSDDEQDEIRGFYATSVTVQKVEPGGPYR